MQRRPVLSERVRDPGFTPAKRDVDALVDLLVDDEVAKAVERAIFRVGASAFDTLHTRLKEARPPLRARIVRAIGRLKDDDRAIEVLLAALDDADAKTRRNAVIALGHVSRAGVEDALLQAWEDDARHEMRRSVAASLGKVGTIRALPVLRRAAGVKDAELSRIAGRAAMMIERTASRAQRGRIEPERPASRPVKVIALARRGVEELLADELSGTAGVSEVRIVGPGRVGAALVGAMRVMFAARTMLSFRFPMATELLSDDDGLAGAIARAVTSDAARSIFGTWTVGPVRYRIAWAEGGHRRAATWDAARAIAARAPDLVNDPTQSVWEVVVSAENGVVDVALVPRALEDPRFAWRRADVPAASHPTLAAALAHVAGVRADDTVWDPFVGSGAELVERALLGPCRALFGSDLDSHALAIAGENLAAAGVHASLERADALTHRPPGVTLVVTNPPMGRRASRTATLGDMLDGFVAHAASVLSRNGRLVWIAPWPKRARVAAERAGLALDWARVVDMGGFDAEMQRWIKS
jgi:23S rRNA G2445 N2-methylase RlmL